MCRKIAAIGGLVLFGAAIVRDVDGGETTPDTSVVGDAEHWSFEPIRAVHPPVVRDAAWPRNPIDQFRLAKLEANGLRPAPPADKRTLIRRVTYDLTGLPPTPDEVAAFLADDSPQAWRRVVDRLLGSPRYGERWGRHWLDLARYADSNGVDENLAYVNAFRYRDYVIRSFNDDKPYDRFVHEQLAGDLLPASPDESPQDRYDRWVATGFLAIGPKMLACDDGRKMELDIVDEQVDTTSRVFMGLTVGCARCHDHKFDPISAEDYYGLAGIFKSTKTMENFKVVAEWHEYVLATADEQARAEAHEKQINETNEALKRRERAAEETFLAVERAKVGAYLTAVADFVSQGDAPANEKDESQPNLEQMAESLSVNHEIAKQWVEHLESVGDDTETIWLVWLLADPESRRAMATEYAAVFARAETMWKQLRAEPEGRKAEQLPDARMEAFRRVLYDKKGPFRLPKDPERFYSAETREELARLRETKESLEQSRPQLARAMGVREGKIENLPVHLRGEYLTLGDEVPRRFPQVIDAGASAGVGDEASGRLQLARWLTHPNHPLTARVMANRLWLWHFGEGLVRTPDNFGVLGQPPTHPDLLDWLARQLIDSGWSLKAMHRLLLDSASYRMSTRFDEACYRKDPENRLGWRFHRRRLAAEEIRDSLLALGGNLDATFYGQLLPNGPRDYVTGTGSKEGTYAFGRRSVYLPVLRSAVYSVLQAFDFADPSVLSGKRTATTVAPQALFMMNSTLVLEQTRGLAERLWTLEPEYDARRIDRAHQEILGRPATQEDVRDGRAFVADYESALQDEIDDVAERRIRAWQGLCRILVASNEFVYVE